MIQLTIDEKFIQNAGGNSLLGALAEKNMMLMAEEKKCTIELIFPQTTMNYKRKNKGPKDFIIYEYNIPCLIMDIIYLQNLGHEIKISMPETEES